MRPRLAAGVGPGWQEVRGSNPRAPTSDLQGLLTLAPPPGSPPARFLQPKCPNATQMPGCGWHTLGLPKLCCDRGQSREGVADGRQASAPARARDGRRAARAGLPGRVRTRVYEAYGVKQAQEWLGHSDPATTLRHYVRLTTAARAKAIAGLDEVTRAALERVEEKVLEDAQPLEDNVVALASRCQRLSAPLDHLLRLRLPASRRMPAELRWNASLSPPAACLPRTAPGASCRGSAPPARPR